MAEGFFMRAVVVAGGALPHPEIDRASIRPDDLLLAADGGGRHCLALGLHPAAVIGDFDSLTPAETQSLAAAGAVLVRHPPRKDQTDLELAVRYASERGATEIVILAGLGGRWDQSIANLLVAGAGGLERLRLTLLDGPQEIHPVRAGAPFEVRGRPGDVVSLIPLAGDARGVTTEGLEYPLRGGTLPFGSTLGISNSLTQPVARITLQHGLILCTIWHLEADGS
jgi:thiamine pyrophosphokinase